MLDGLEEFSKFKHAVEQYLEVFDTAEKRLNGSLSYQASLMRKCWESRSYWYFSAVNTPKGLYSLFVQYIQRIFKPDRDHSTMFDELVSKFWDVNAGEVIE